MKLRKQAVSMALAASLAMSLMPGMPLVPASGAEASAEELGGQSEVLVQPKAADETEDAVEITGMTIADTYYKENGEFPMYVEYTYTQKKNSPDPSLTLKVVDKNTGKEVAQSDNSTYTSSLGEFWNFKAAGVESGESYDLLFRVYCEDKLLKEVEQKVAFEDKDAWASREYLPTNKQAFKLNLYIARSNETVVPEDIKAVYLLDEKGEIAATTGKYDDLSMRISNETKYKGIFVSSPTSPCYKIVPNNTDPLTFYRTRKLKKDETLTPAYVVEGNDEPVKLEDVKFTVTDDPYIWYALADSEDAGENAICVKVYGYNIDFSKLGLELEREGSIVGKAESYVLGEGAIDGFDDEQINCVRYFLQLTDNDYSYIDNVGADLKFTYPEKLVQDMEAKRIKRFGNKIQMIWNPKMDTIEYHDNFLSSGASISYKIKTSDGDEVASGSGIIVDKNHHIEINLPNTFETDGFYSVNLTFRRQGLENEEEINNSVQIYANKEKEQKAVLNSDDESRLPVSRSATISKSVAEKEIMTLSNQRNYADSVSLEFNSAELAKEYCSEENQEKISLHITDAADKNEKVYTLSAEDGFIIPDNIMNNSVSLYYSEKMREELKDKYYYHVYVYYGDEMVKKYGYDTSKSLYEYGSDEYDGQNYEVYKKSSDDSFWWYPMALVDDDGNSVSSYEKGKSTYNCIRTNGSESVFPVTVKVTDWYNIKQITSFTMQRGGAITEENFRGLSDKKIYGVYLEGANGYHAAYTEVYLATGTYVEPEGKPGTTPGESDPGTTTPGEDDPGTTTPTTPEESNPGTTTPTTPEESNPGTTTPTTPGGSNPGTTTPTTPGGSNPGTTTTPGGNTSGTTGNNNNSSTGTTAPDNSNTEEDKKPEDNQQTDNSQNDNSADNEQPGTTGNTQTPGTSDNADDEKEENKATGKLTLEKKKFTVTKGKTAKIEITSDVNTKVTYTSSDPSIATVNKNGKIIAKKKGTVTITVSANGKEKEVTVTVEPEKKASTVKLSKKMKLSDTKTSLKKGEKLTIKKAAGTGKVTYRSSNKKIATVSAKGVVKAKKKGTVTIFVENGSKTVKLKITVKA